MTIVQYILISSILLCNNHLFTMEKPLESLPLTWIDREIFLELVRQHGAKSIKKQLNYAKSFKHSGKTMQSSIDYPVTVSIELKIYQTEDGNVLYKIVHEAITLKEKNQKSSSKDILDKKSNPKNNFIGNYTEYWHKEDEKGNYYIQCKSEFTNKAALESILKGLEKPKEKNFTLQ